MISLLVRYVSIYPRSLAYYQQSYCLYCCRTSSVILSRDRICMHFGWNTIRLDSYARIDLVFSVYSYIGLRLGPSVTRAYCGSSDIIASLASLLREYPSLPHLSVLPLSDSYSDTPHLRGLGHSPHEISMISRDISPRWTGYIIDHISIAI